MDPILEHAGLLTVLKISILPGNRWDFLDTGLGDEGETATAAVIEALGRDGRTAVDLIAWPLNDPSRFLSMFGAASMLGIRNVTSSGEYIFNAPLRIWRTPLRWLQSGCRGAVVVNPAVAARDLLDALGRISGEDREHSEELFGLVASLFDPARFVAPSPVYQQGST
ncbi:hypothetical protein [Aurantimonas sp. HBX-1]|uniref:hypothetical protein n=1 Tax=Aurantimonas sp. HBX-1 TaxID=2906072 RepID=UPI001F25F4B0|nr:hypothetical protein [Aurantimonas sp. HBX-1]UIJ72357.1 hypothetical protein LXB15_01425 [Aurantimonas sp. HBX-1]